MLILQRSRQLDWQPSQWEISYGRIDQFEDAETGLRRELYEELGPTPPFLRLRQRHCLHRRLKRCRRPLRAP
ncbi:NUDIX domain-containing protein [Candidatus Roizmanbacteria bacterium]|nr:NUDIX domain-containing protein [Candidatus Roizmanbacteria bacterium]